LSGRFLGGRILGSLSPCLSEKEHAGLKRELKEDLRDQKLISYWGCFAERWDLEKKSKRNQGSEEIRDKARNEAFRKKDLPLFKFCDPYEGGFGKKGESSRFGKSQNSIENCSPSDSYV